MSSNPYVITDKIKGWRTWVLLLFRKPNLQLSNTPKHTGSCHKRLIKGYPSSLHFYGFLWFFHEFFSQIYFSEFFSLSLNFSLFFLSVTGRAGGEMMVFYTIWGSFSSGFSLYTSCSLERTWCNQRQHKQLTFPYHEESSKQLVIFTWSLLNKQVSKHTGACHVTQLLRKQAG